MPLPGFATGGLLNSGRHARQRRLAKEAARKKYGAKTAMTGVGKRRAARKRAVPPHVAAQRAKQVTQAGKREPVPQAGKREMCASTSWLRHQPRDLTKALESGCSDAELRVILQQVRHDGGYGTHAWTGPFKHEWPPEPDFAEADHSQSHAAPKKGACLHEEEDAASGNAALIGLLDMQGSDEEEGSSTYTEDSLSDDMLPPPAARVEDRRIPGCTRLYHTYPEPLKSVPLEESTMHECESSDQTHSSETAAEEAGGAHRRTEYGEYSIEDILAADAGFQDKLNRWRMGLPNFERPDPVLSQTPHTDHELDDKFEYVYRFLFGHC